MPETTLTTLSLVAARPSRQLSPITNADLIAAVEMLRSAFHAYRYNDDAYSLARWDRAEFLAGQAIARARGAQ
jgi:hypothetical protein